MAINYPYYDPAPQTANPYGSGSTFNLSPATSGYSATFGGVPGNIGLPQPYNDLNSVYPNLTGTNSALSGDILSQLGGKLSPGTVNMMQDSGAAWGVKNGMPGFTPGSLTQNRTLRNLGLTSEQQVQAGISNYSHVIPSVSGTQTVNPSLQTEIASHNATMNSAPNPAAAQSYARQLFDQYLQKMRGPGGGTQDTGMLTPSGGTGAGNLGGTPSAPWQNYPQTGSGYAPDSSYPGTEMAGAENVSSLLGEQSQMPYADTSSPWGSGVDLSGDWGSEWDLGF